MKTRMPKIIAKRAGSERRNSGGFTMVEMLISVLLAGIVTSAAMMLYITQHKQLLVQDEVSDMQSNIRAATAELATKIRMAGFKVPDPAMSIRAANTNPDSIAIAFDTGEVGNVRLSLAMSSPSVELQCNGYVLTGIANNDWLYIYDPTARVGEYFVATNVQNSPPRIQHVGMNFSRNYPLGSQIFKIRRYKYYIDNTTDASHPNLMQQVDNGAAQIYAENITNLNLTYKISSGAIVNVPPVADMIREVIITVNARTDKSDSEFSARQYRTRALSTRVKVRNLGVN
jgi:prepilin-type N-terminal cleavage/methylation domain-containing protein